MTGIYRKVTHFPSERDGEGNEITLHTPGEVRVDPHYPLLLIWLQGFVFHHQDDALLGDHVLQGGGAGGGAHSARDTCCLDTLTEAGILGGEEGGEEGEREGRREGGSLSVIYLFIFIL